MYLVTLGDFAIVEDGLAVAIVTQKAIVQSILMQRAKTILF